MENATKALLIAAAILVVILLIAFGMRVLNTSGGAATSAQQTGTKITEQSNRAAGSASNAISGLDSYLN